MAPSILDIGGVCDAIDGVVDDLMELSMSFHRTGSVQTAAIVRNHVKRLMDIPARLREIQDAVIGQVACDAEQASRNMLQAAFAVVDLREKDRVKTLDPSSDG